MEKELELEKLKIKCKAYENEIAFLRLNIKSLKVEIDKIINSKGYIVLDKLRKFVWWSK